MLHILFFIYVIYIIHTFFYKEKFYKTISLKNPNTLRKCQENLQPQMSELQSLKIQIFPRAL